MSVDWLLIGCAAGAFIACAVCFILGACMAAGRADEQAAEHIARIEAERAVRHGDACPWEFTPYATPARRSGSVGVTGAAPRESAK